MVVFLAFEEVTRLLTYSRRLEADDIRAGTSSSVMDSELSGGNVGGSNMGGSGPSGGGGGGLSGGPAGNYAGKEFGGSDNEPSASSDPTVAIQHYGNMDIRKIPDLFLTVRAVC